ncbi:hypothetical protein TNCV_3554831 [Trichonephila clavipes]|nr:hypothetical protein TNCV_3554831 [Trichonephila clavipes]
MSCQSSKICREDLFGKIHRDWIMEQGLQDLSLSIILLSSANGFFHGSGDSRNRLAAQPAARKLWKIAAMLC